MKTTTPLLNKVILTWLAKSYVYARLPDAQRQAMEAPQGIGYGIGLAVALFVMQGMWFIAERYSDDLTISIEAASLVRLPFILFVTLC